MNKIIKYEIMDERGDENYTFYLVWNIRGLNLIIINKIIF